MKQVLSVEQMKHLQKIGFDTSDGSMCFEWNESDSDNMVYRECELDFSAIDWEQRRYELAKAAMQGFCSNSHEQVMNASLNMTVEWSLGFADALIKKLKGE